MWLIPLALLLAVTTANAQPTPIFDKAGGRQVGTATVDGNRVYLRDMAGEHYATIVRNPDNTKVLVDQHGKPLSLDAVAEKLK